MMSRRTPTLRLATAAAAALLLPGLATAAGSPPGDSAAPGAHPRPREMWVLGGEGDEPIQFRGFFGGGFLGVSLLHLTPELRTHFGVPEDAGVMVSQVVPDSPAAAAGLEVGDVITAIDGDPVADGMDLSSKVRRHKGGETVDLDVYRDGARRQLSVTLKERDREAFDLGDFFEWRGKGEGEGEGRAITIRPKVRLMQREELDPEILQEIQRRLDAIDWDKIAARRPPQPSAQLEKRLAELEKRLKELEKELDQATKDKR
jgi:PDZ domain